MKKYIHDTIVHNTKAAKKIVPFLINLFQPKNVIDVGCGTGTWLKVFLDNGIEEIVGIEGYHLQKSKLLIDEHYVYLHDLEKPLPQKNKYDLLISLEVAEHLSENTSSQFVKSLTTISDVIFFSAAIPFQGGQNHMNEQWNSYWISLFEQNDFKIYDVVRPAFWNDVDVEFWYKQNTFIAINSKLCDTHPINQLPSFYGYNMVHPDLFLKKANYLASILSGEVGLKTLIKLCIKSLRYI